MFNCSNDNNYWINLLLFTSKPKMYDFLNSKQTINSHGNSLQFLLSMDNALTVFSDSTLPNIVETCQSLLLQINEIRREMLEISMRLLVEMEMLLNLLYVIETDNLGDSRTDHMKCAVRSAVSYVECYVESLHDRRRQLEILWVMRKTQLEQCLSKCLLYRDLDQVCGFLISHNV